MKVRFKYDEKEEVYIVLAKRKSTGKYERIGIANPMAVKAIKAGQTEWIKFDK